MRIAHGFDAESAEAEFMYQYVAHAPAELDASAVRLAGGVVVHVRNDPMGGYWTKALGFPQVTAEVLDEIIGFYRSRGARTAVLQLSPHLLSASFIEMREQRGITPDRRLVKLGGPIEEVKLDATTDLRIAPVEPEQAGLWGEAVMRAFGVPGTALSQMLANSVANPAFHPFAAWDGETVVAGGNLLVHGEVGSLSTGATGPDHRGRGAQSALIAARLRAARELGCRWVIAETGWPDPGTRNPSLENLRRAGLPVLYERTNWRWTE